MKTLYIECKMGASGDMLTAALLDLVDREEFINKINSLNLPKTVVSAETVVKQGIKGQQVSVIIDGEEESADGARYKNGRNHTDLKATLQDVAAIINELDLKDKVKKEAIEIYTMLAEAESSVHNTTVDNIHFHELGTLDAIADIVGVCILMDMISADRVVVSPINVGSGTVKCSHGTLPVPAPATAYLLQGIPMYSSDEIDTELCTPTGAVLLKYFADEYGAIPTMKTEKTGYGFGKKEFGGNSNKLNCLRTFFGEEIQSVSSDKDTIIELKCNIDDMTAEDMGYATNKLFEEGALDVFTTPINMKKNRPGILLTVICQEETKDKLTKAIFIHTSTIGIRETICNRYILNRTEDICHTRYGDIRVKNAAGYGVNKCKVEYEDIARIADEENISLSEVRQNIEADLHK